MISSFFPPFGFPHFRNPLFGSNPCFPNNFSDNSISSKHDFYKKIHNGKNTYNEQIKNSKNESYTYSNNFEECFEILGIKLYFDDLLIICLLIFLYNEEVKDKYLYIALLILLLS